MSGFKKLASIFVETEDDKQAPASAPGKQPHEMDDIDRQLAELTQLNQNAGKAPVGAPAPSGVPAQTPAPAPAPAPQKVPTITAGKLDYQAVYDLASVTKAAFGAEDASKMINELPTELPIPIKRQTFKAMLNAMAAIGVTIDTILNDAVHKIAALQSYSNGVQKQVDDFKSKGDLEITNVESQIAQLQQKITNIKAQQVQAGQTGELTHKLCQDEIDRLTSISTFLSDTPVSVPATTTTTPLPTVIS